MRYDAEHKARTREKVLKAAARAIRTEGPHKVGVAEVMAAAGLTHGGFYAHFPSKDALVAASIGEMFRESSTRFGAETDGLTPAQGLSRYVDFYLSARHRDARGAGCPLPYLSADAPRLPAVAQAAFADGVERLRVKLAAALAKLPSPDPEADAASMLSELVGALSLARADPDMARSDAVLARSRAAIKRRFALEISQ